MSTIFFGVDELANVILVATEAFPESEAKLRVMRAQAHCLAAYSAANCAAYRDLYADRHAYAREAVPSTAAEILEWALAPGATGNKEKAQGFLRLALYNLDDHRSPALEKLVASFQEVCGE